MSTARMGFGYAELPDGRVVVAGGWNGTGVLKTAEIYDPAQGAWSALGNMRSARANFTLSPLPNGLLLAAGGESPSGAPLESCEVFSPASGKWRSVLPLATGRYYHATSVLQDGRVMVSGGCSLPQCGDVTATVEIFDLKTARWSDGGTLAYARDYHTSTTLQNGMVLVTGGYGYSGQLAAAEIWDPATGVWSSAGTMTAARSVHATVALEDGRALVIGGQGGFGTFLSSCELYDPTTGSWTATGTMADKRQYVTAARMRDGRVLVSGGWILVYPLQLFTDRCEVYDPATATWTPTGKLHTARSDHACVLLQSGKLLAVGGLSDSGFLKSAELYMR